MPPSRKPLEIDAVRIFRWSFLVVFLVLEWSAWVQVARRLAFLPRRRVPVVRLAIWTTTWAAFGAFVLAVV